MLNALLIMKDEGLYVGGGAAYYVTSLLDHPDFTREHLTQMKYAGLGGPVPAAVTKRLDELGITVLRSYGSTEHPSITGSLYTAPRDKRLYTDGNRCPAWRSGSPLTGRSSAAAPTCAWATPIQG